MEININTPALLFPAITLLLLAYSNRYLALANLVRKLHDEYKRGDKHPVLIKQIRSLRGRINLVRYMQGLGVFSFLCCVISMYSIYREWMHVASYVFAFSMLCLMASLIISLIEITRSTKAIELELSDLEELEQSNIFTDLFPSDEKKEDKPDKIL
jgi:hypothetical protein